MALVERTLDLSRPLALGPDVSLRDESFGALAYHHGNRRLVFLKSRTLVEVVRSLERFDSGDDALEELVPAAERSRYAAALASLHASELIDER